MKITDVNYCKTFRQHILDGTGLIGPVYAPDGLGRSRFFIQTMEQFIDDSENEEVKHFEALAQSLSSEERDEFWQWNYPIHWQDIFGVRIRSAFCIQLCSQVEAILGDIARRIQVIEGCPVIGKKKKFNKGSTLEKHKRYFETYAKFEGLDEEIWSKMGFVFRIRNAHIHFQGFDVEMDDNIGFRQFLSALPNIGTEYNFIELKAGACDALLEIVELFNKSLLEEYETYRKRTLAFDQQRKGGAQP